MRKPLNPSSPATVLICKLKFVIFEEEVYEDDDFAHARGLGDDGFFARFVSVFSKNNAIASLRLHEPDSNLLILNSDDTGAESKTDQMQNICNCIKMQLHVIYLQFVLNQQKVIEMGLFNLGTVFAKSMSSD